MNNDMILRDWTINVEFFSEVMHKLRVAPEYAELVNNAIEVPKKADTRHLNAVRRIATAYCKLLFPHITNVEDIDKMEFDRYCLQPAIHRRDQVRQQCANIDTESSFSQPMPNIRVKL
jgi:ATP-dependent Lon protease